MDWLSLGLNAGSIALSIAGLGVPAVLAGAATYFIKNKAVADVVGQAAGVAYTHMADSFAKDHTVDFGTAKDAAVAAGAAAVQTTLNKLVPNNEDAVGKVAGALGQLLAGDPNFHVTNPTTKLASSSDWFQPVPADSLQQDTATRGGGS